MKKQKRWNREIFKRYMNTFMDRSTSLMTVEALEILVLGSDGKLRWILNVNVVPNNHLSDILTLFVMNLIHNLTLSLKHDDVV